MTLYSSFSLSLYSDNSTARRQHDATMTTHFDNSINNRFKNLNRNSTYSNNNNNSTLNNSNNSGKTALVGGGLYNFMWIESERIMFYIYLTLGTIFVSLIMLIVAIVIIRRSCAKKPKTCSYQWMLANASHSINQSSSSTNSGSRVCDCALSHNTSGALSQSSEDVSHSFSGFAAIGKTHVCNKHIVSNGNANAIGGLTMDNDKRHSLEHCSSNKVAANNQQQLMAQQNNFILPQVDIEQEKQQLAQSASGSNIINTNNCDNCNPLSKTTMSAFTTTNITNNFMYDNVHSNGNNLENYTYDANTKLSSRSNSSSVSIVHPTLRSSSTSSNNHLAAAANNNNNNNKQSPPIVPPTMSNNNNQDSLRSTPSACTTNQQYQRQAIAACNRATAIVRGNQVATASSRSDGENKVSDKTNRNVISSNDLNTSTQQVDFKGQFQQEHCSPSSTVSTVDIGKNSSIVTDHSMHSSNASTNHTFLSYKSSDLRDLNNNNSAYLNQRYQRNFQVQQQQLSQSNQHFISPSHKQQSPRFHNNNMIINSAHSTPGGNYTNNKINKNQSIDQHGIKHLVSRRQISAGSQLDRSEKDDILSVENQRCINKDRSVDEQRSKIVINCHDDKNNGSGHIQSHRHINHQRQQSIGNSNCFNSILFDYDTEHHYEEISSPMRTRFQVASNNHNHQLTHSQDLVNMDVGDCREHLGKHHTSLLAEEDDDEESSDHNINSVEDEAIIISVSNSTDCVEEIVYDAVNDSGEKVSDDCSDDEANHIENRTNNCRLTTSCDNAKIDSPR